MRGTFTHLFNAGAWIFHEGDQGDCAYLIEEGEVVIVLERDEELIPLGVYKPGSLFGEMAIIDDQPRSASAFTQTRCILRKITREQLNYRLEQADPILKVCISVLMHHLRKTLSHIDPLKMESEDKKNDQNKPIPDLLQYAADQAVKSSATGTHLEDVHPPMTSASEFLSANLPSPILSSPVSPSVVPMSPIPKNLSETPEFNPLKYDAFLQAIKTLDLESELQLALQENQLCLFYQPIMEIKTERLAGFEALMRWIHPERGLIPPSDFIPIAERSGMIVDMTYWAIETASLELVHLRDQLLSHVDLAPHVSEQLFVSVNFSSRDFLNQNLMNHVNELIELHRLPPNSLKIEITESVLMNSPKEVERVLTECKRNGASIAIDDFGTGYSSLSYLQSMPADTLKIDQAFIRPMHDNERHMALVESIIHLAQRLDMKTVAEGVETLRDVESLALLQCDFLQGYHFARPLPTSEIIEWAENYWLTESFNFLG